MSATLAALLFAAAPLAAVDQASIDAVIAGIYKHYARDDIAAASWEQPVFSAQTGALIRRWQRVMPENELDGLNDADWFCQCQDWNPKAFRARITAREVTATGVVRVRMTLNHGGGNVARQHMILRKEKGQWRVDDLIAPGFETGLKQALRETIAEDEKLQR